MNKEQLKKEIINSNSLESILKLMSEKYLTNLFIFSGSLKDVKKYCIDWIDTHSVNELKDKSLSINYKSDY